MANIKLRLPPPPTQAVITKDGLPTPALVRYLIDIAQNFKPVDDELGNIGDIIDEHETRLTYIEIKLDAVEDDIIEIKARLTTVEGEVASIKLRLDAVEQGLTDLEIRVDDNETAIADHETRISTIENAGYITDAPQDGELYGRKDGQWEIIP